MLAPVGDPVTAVKFTITISFAVTVVVVKSVTVALWTLVPVETPTPDVFIKLEIVGMAVPDEIFQNVKVAVPEGVTDAL